MSEEYSFAVARFAFMLFVFIPAVAVYREDSGLAMGRRDFALWVVLYLIVVVASLGVAADIESHSILLAGASFTGAAVAYMFYQRVVRRARDAGLGKGIAYVAVIPLLNLVVFFLLIMQPGVPPATPGGGGPSPSPSPSARKAAARAYPCRIEPERIPRRRSGKIAPPRRLPHQSGRFDAAGSVPSHPDLL